MKNPPPEARDLTRLHSALTKIRILNYAAKRPVDAASICGHLYRRAAAIQPAALNRTLRSMVRSGLLGRTGNFTYFLTARGKQALDLAREQLALFGSTSPGFLTRRPR